MQEIHMIALKTYHQVHEFTWLKAGENIKPTEFKCQFVKISDTHDELSRRIHRETARRHVGIHPGQAPGGP